MAEDTRPAETVDTTPAPEFKPTEEYKVLSAAMETLAKSADTMGAKLENMAKIQADLAVEKSKMRPVGEKRLASGRTIKHAMTTRAHDSDTRELHELNDRARDRMIFRMVQARNVNANTPVDLRNVPREAWDDIPEFQEFQSKAAGSWWDSTTTASLNEWVPVAISPSAIDFYTVDADLPLLFDNITIPRGVESVTIPVESTRAHAFVEAQNTAYTTPIANFANASILNQPQGVACTLIPKKMSNMHAMSMEAVEDVAVDLLARGRASSAKAVRSGIAEAMINGQTASDGTLDDAPSTSGLYAADGWDVDGTGVNSLRLHCIVGSGGAYTTAAGGAITSAMILALRASLGKYGARPDEIAFITSPKGYLTMLADTDVKTVDKFGPLATVLSGQLAAVGGAPVIMTSEFPEDMAATGIDAGTSTTTGGILVNRKRWFFGTARTMEQTLIPQPGYDALYIVTRMRADFKTAVVAEHNAHYLIGVS